MNSIEKQITNKCIHFTGLTNKECSVGVKYKDVEVRDSRPIKIPCLKDSLLSGGTCIKAEYPTEEEVEKQVAEIMKDNEMQMNAYLVVKQYIEKTGVKLGKVICPSCGGNLHYTQAESNGHIWGNCKCGIGWME